MIIFKTTIKNFKNRAGVIFVNKTFIDREVLVLIEGEKSQQKLSNLFIKESD